MVLEMNNKRKLDGRIAVVTGASRLGGIGAAICQELAKEGADIFFTCWTSYDLENHTGITPDEPDQLQDEIEKIGVRCKKIELDLAKPEAYRLLFEEVEKQFGSPADILINNACYSVNDDVETISPQSLDDHYKVNVRATTLLTAEFAKRFKRKSGGRIVNITTGWSQGPMPDEISYAITKSAVESLTYTLSSTLATRGITINAVNPGPTDTGWMTEEIKQELLPRSPSGRLGKPKDAARLISFLVNDEGEWVTGQVIHSEGGFIN